MTPDSASKLRALEAEVRSGRGWDSGWTHWIDGTLRDALPALIAVVEAAEEMSEWLEIQSSNCYGRDLIPIREFDAALSELNRAL